MMGKQMHLDPAAEKEATEIGMRFVNSADVIGDMSRTYGADLSTVRIHTDEIAARRAAERGVDAYSTGKDIFFARGAFDRSDPASRGLLAHELSHSLQQGVAGDLSGVAHSAPMGAEQGGRLLDWFRRLFRRREPEPLPEDRVQFAPPEERSDAAGIGRFFRENNTNETRQRFHDPRRQGLFEAVQARVADQSVYGPGLSNVDFANASGTVKIRGLKASREIGILQGPMGGDRTNDQIGGLYEKLLGGGRYRELKDLERYGHLKEEQREELARFTPERVEEMDARFDEGMLELKALQLAQLRRLKDKYGVYGSQMHPEDFITRVGPELFSDTAMLQDADQMLRDGGRYFDFENNAEDREYRTLCDYYNDLFNTMQGYALSDENIDGDFRPGDYALSRLKTASGPRRILENEANVRALGGQGFGEREQRAYEKRVRKRFGSRSLRNRLFGRFA